MSQVWINTIRQLETAPGFARDISVHGTRRCFPWAAQARHLQSRWEEVLTWGCPLAEEHGSSHHVIRLWARTNGESKSPVLTMGKEEGFASTTCKAKPGPIPHCVVSCLGTATLHRNVTEPVFQKHRRNTSQQAL